MYMALQTNNMKKTVFIVAAVFSSYALMAQGHYQQAPEPVRHSFEHQYPQATKPEWSQQNGQWHARFNDQGPESRGEMVAHYGHDGRNIDSHIPYDRQDVPAPVSHWAQRRYKHGTYEYTRIERPGEEGFFQVRVNIGGKYHTSYVDEQGREKVYRDQH
jgi:hypothetical protein